MAEQNLHCLPSQFHGGVLRCSFDDFVHTWLKSFNKALKFRSISNISSLSSLWSVQIYLNLPFAAIHPRKTSLLLRWSCGVTHYLPYIFMLLVLIFFPKERPDLIQVPRNPNAEFLSRMESSENSWKNSILRRNAALLAHPQGENMTISVTPALLSFPIQIALTHLPLTPDSQTPLTHLEPTPTHFGISFHPHSPVPSSSSPWDISAIVGNGFAGWRSTRTGRRRRGHWSTVLGSWMTSPSRLRWSGGRGRKCGGLMSRCLTRVASFISQWEWDAWPCGCWCILSSRTRFQKKRGEARYSRKWGWGVGIKGSGIQHSRHCRPWWEIGITRSCSFKLPSPLNLTPHLTKKKKHYQRCPENWHWRYEIRESR